MVCEADNRQARPNTRDSMRLADFIDANAEAIADAVETFAATLLPAASHLDREALCDHMPLLLQAITTDFKKYKGLSCH
jgi:hypothetical protein